jgi:hypothetical protein
MKLKHIIPLVLITVVNMQLVQGQNQSKVYDFPIRPGTKEWQNLPSYEERLNAYSIPDKLLENMNTADLVQTCLDYPEFRLIMTRNSLQQGYDYLKSIFNGFRELEKRKDAGAELINEHKKLNPADIKNYGTPVERGGFGFKFTYIEILLAQKPILTNLDTENKKSLIEKSISNYVTIEKMPDDYATFGLLTPALLLGRLLDLNNQSDFTIQKSKNQKLKAFVDYSEIGDTSVLPDIISCSKSYLKQLENE